MKNKAFMSPPRSLSRSFTLIELVVVIIIVGLLAAVGISQYAATVEKSRLAEAKIRIGTMRQLAYEYYMNNGAMATITNADIGVDYTCTPTSFYQYQAGTRTDTYVNLAAMRCTTGGKVPNASREYYYYFRFYYTTGQGDWHCQYTDGPDACFGLPR
ncbi:MAG: prepilin-type N-terminal cleavage/methylation domain-containing protein [Candidatus Omnitrophica bacterium]|nr:prepilin-type N-terminal cleavage/methylation domain-containing protein [Candidatus Omnitrophota bacterium]